MTAVPGQTMIGRLSPESRDQLLLALLAGVATYLLIGDFGVRLANTSTDDGLVAYAYYFKFPELFSRDAHMRDWGWAVLGSMLNWLPALLFKYGGVPPELFFWSLPFVQNMLLALALYRLALVMVRSREAALLAALFTLTFQPHWWNLGLFADLNWMPYGAWLALPFLVFASSFALEGRVAAAATTLVIGGLAHPVLGLFATAMAGAYWVLLSLSERRAGAIPGSLILLALVCVVFMLPVTFVRLGVEEISASEFMPLVLRNGHAVPWALPGYMPLLVKSALLILAMAVLAWFAAGHPSVHPRLRLFLVAATAVVIAACLLHIGAYLARSASVLRVISTRSTILLLVLFVPPVASLAWRVISHSQSHIARFLACYVVAWPSPMAFLAAVLVLPSAAQGAHGDGRSGFWQRICRIAGTALLVLVLLHYVPKLGERVDTHVLGPLMAPEFIPVLFGFPSLRFHTLLVVYLGALVMAYRNAPSRVLAGKIPLATALLAPLSFYLLASSYTRGRDATSGEAREYYEVQVWARSSTPVDATFIVGDTSVHEGWRNFTHRARISAGGCGFYVCTKSALSDAQKARAFIARHGRPYGPDSDTRSLSAYARAYGGDYAVRRKAWPAVDFPVAFQNEGYVVYDLR